MKLRVQTYEKIPDAEADIIQEIETKKRSLDSSLLCMNQRDITEICRPDRTDVIRCSIAAVLVDDLGTIE